MSDIFVFYMFFFVFERTVLTVPITKYAKVTSKSKNCKKTSSFFEVICSSSNFRIDFYFYTTTEKIFFLIFDSHHIITFSKCI